ncbi:MAG: hypothetical protein J0I06_15375 [Planctomycetes bacterium]|nr:hypothetical protein [Planctomycetota bacterium]
MDLSGDDHLERAVTELGEPEALFRVGRGRFLAKLALGVLLVVIGIVANYLWWFRGPAQIDHFIFHLLYIVPLFGAGLLLHMYRNRGLFVLVYPNGLLRLRHGEVDSFPWHEIENVKLRVQRAEGAEFTRDPDGTPLACWLPADVPTFKLWDAGLTVVRGDGVEAHFGPALSEYDQLSAEVQRRTFAALWPHVRTRFRNGERVSFGELEVSAVGLAHAGKTLPWRELKEVAIAQGKLSIKQTGKWLPWALIDLAGVPNPHLLFALTEEARLTAPPPPREPHERPAEQRRD